MIPEPGFLLSIRTVIDLAILPTSSADIAKTAVGWAMTIVATVPIKAMRILLEKFIDFIGE